MNTTGGINNKPFCACINIFVNFFPEISIYRYQYWQECAFLKALPIINAMLTFWLNVAGRCSSRTWRNFLKSLLFSLGFIIMGRLAWCNSTSWRKLFARKTCLEVFLSPPTRWNSLEEYLANTSGHWTVFGENTKGRRGLKKEESETRQREL